MAPEDSETPDLFGSGDGFAADLPVREATVDSHNETLSARATPTGTPHFVGPPCSDNATLCEPSQKQELIPVPPARSATLREEEWEKVRSVIEKLRPAKEEGK